MLIYIILLLVLLIIAIYARAAYLSASTKGNKITNYKHSQSALLVIDMQNDTLLSKQYQGKTEIMRNINTAVNYAQTNGMHVIYIRQEFKRNPIDAILSGGRYKAGKHGSELSSQLRHPAEHVFTKFRTDTFSVKEFESYLIENQIDTLYLVGADASACVYKTALGGVSRGYHVHILKDSVFNVSKRIFVQLLREYETKGIHVCDLNALKSKEPFTEK